MNFEEAISKAKYNEAVVVTVPAADGDQESSSPREMVLVATLDEENGGIAWKDVLAETSASSSSDVGGTDDDIDEEKEDDSKDLDQAIVRHLRTKRWVLPMLNDHLRNELYDLAIQKAAIKAASNVATAKRDTLQVLDIGTGTALLAMMAAKHCRSALDNLNAQNVKVKVTSIEMASAMARLGRLTLSENGLSDTITVVEGHSSDPSFTLDQPADLCTAELLESGLLGEGVLPAMRDAWARHLRPDAVVVPLRARVYAQVLEGYDSVACYRGPTVPQHPPENVERLCLSANRRDVLLGGSGGGGVRVPIKAEALFDSLSDTMEMTPRARPLSDPALVLDFDFADDRIIPPPTGRSRKVRLPATATGTAHGVLFWWELDMEEDLMYTTEAGKGPWQDHWQQCLFVFGADDDECPKLEQGREFTLVVSHGDHYISFSIENTADKTTSDEPPPAKQQRIDQEHEIPPTHRHISPDRALQLNDADRMKIIRDSIKYGTDYLQGETMLDISDFGLCGIMAAVHGSLRVISLESSSGDLPMVAARVAQLGNNLPRSSFPDDTDFEPGDPRFEILNTHAESVTLDMLDSNPNRANPDHVFSEVYYEVLEGWHLQEALNLYYLISALRRRNVLYKQSSGYSPTPAYARVMGCAIELHDIASAYGGLQKDAKGHAPIRGFSHEAVDKHASRYHKFDANFPLWQYRHRFLSAPFKIATITYGEGVGFGEEREMGMEIAGNGQLTEGSFIKTGTCHAMAFWIEYGMMVDSYNVDGSVAEEGHITMLSTWRSSHKQAIRMLAEPIHIDQRDIDQGAKFTCKATFGGLGNCEDHDFELNVVK